MRIKKRKSVEASVHMQRLYRGKKVLGCLGAWAIGCLDDWVHGCLDAWMLG